MGQIFLRIEIKLYLFTISVLFLSYQNLRVEFIVTCFVAYIFSIGKIPTRVVQAFLNFFDFAPPTNQFLSDLTLTQLFFPPILPLTTTDNHDYFLPQSIYNRRKDWLISSQDGWRDIRRCYRYRSRWVRPYPRKSACDAILCVASLFFLALFSSVSALRHLANFLSPRYYLLM